MSESNFMIPSHSVIKNTHFKTAGEWLEFGDLEYVTFENCEFNDCAFTANSKFVKFKNCEFNDCHFGDGNSTEYAFEFNTCLFWMSHFSASTFTLLKLKYCGFYDCSIVNGHVELDKNKVKCLLDFSGYATDVFCESLSKQVISELTPTTEWEWMELFDEKEEEEE